ncbi:hypothetical protein EDD21DRAFT_207402 [Dissophora ornata]|nr:hypothetical protein EDD21DRAFT_207402 [Dissophora ornata]
MDCWRSSHARSPCANTRKHQHCCENAPWLDGTLHPPIVRQQCSFAPSLLCPSALMSVEETAVLSCFFLSNIGALWLFVCKGGGGQASFLCCISRWAIASSWTITDDEILICSFPIPISPSPLDACLPQTTNILVFFIVFFLAVSVSDTPPLPLPYFVLLDHLTTKQKRLCCRMSVQ